MFFLGAPEAVWLARSATPLMLSRSRLAGRRAPLSPARAPWFLDSAAFTELEAHGRWTVSAEEWAKLARRWADEAGQLAAVATQDWLCVPPALARTGLSVAEHQARTVRSFLELRELDAALPWAPTLQGWAPDDYHRHAESYEAAGVDLAAQQLVGLGSIAPRQHTPVVAQLVGGLHRAGHRNLHAFGAKELGLRSWGWAVASADSMAWSTIARRQGIKAASCGASHPDCRNCLAWAEEWAPSMAAHIAQPAPASSQLDLFT